jgi:hypothetical protein
MQLAKIREHMVALVAPDLIRLIAQVIRVFAGTEVTAEAENANLVSVLDLDEHRYLIVSLASYYKVVVASPPALLRENP